MNLPHLKPETKKRKVKCVSEVSGHAARTAQMTLKVSERESDTVFPLMLCLMVVCTAVWFQISHWSSL